MCVFPNVYVIIEIIQPIFTLFKLCCSAYWYRGYHQGGEEPEAGAQDPQPLAQYLQPGVCRQKLFAQSLYHFFCPSIKNWIAKELSIYQINI